MTRHDYTIAIQDNEQFDEIKFIELLCTELQPAPQQLDRCIAYYRDWLASNLSSLKVFTPTDATPQEN